MLMTLAGPVRAQDTGVLFWAPAEREARFRAMEAQVPHVRIPAAPQTRALPPGEPLDLDPDAYMASQKAAGLLVLQNGRVRLERYGLGLRPQDHWTSFSMTKSVTSMLVGAAIADGSIDSVDDPIVRYLPQMRGGAYETVTLDQLLTMTSGVAWNEDYTDPASDVVGVFAAPDPGGMDPTVRYLSGLPRAAEPGALWHYNTGETNLVGVLLRQAVDRPLSDYLFEKIWAPAGMESPAYWMLDRRGEAVGGCCLSASLRDWGRLGLFALDAWNGAAPTLPGDWMRGSTRKRADIGVDGRGYGRMWWTFDDGSFQARGIFGQTLLVEPSRGLVVVILAAWPDAVSDAGSAARAAFLQQVTEAIDAETP